MTDATHFSEQAEHYAAHRPGYPTALYEYLAALALKREVAWDCATGTGQAAIGLAAQFDRVIATDASPDLISQAAQRERVSFRTAPAEQSGLPACSVDAVTVAQALHWFDLTAFYREAQRVLTPGGVLAVWCYDRAEINSEVNRVLGHLRRDVLASYWSRAVEAVASGYRTLSFPFEERRAPAFEMDARWTLGDLVAYLQTWSAAQAFERERGHSPVDVVARDLAAAWPDPGAERIVRWALHLRIGIHNAPGTT